MQLVCTVSFLAKCCDIPLSPIHQLIVNGSVEDNGIETGEIDLDLKECTEGSTVHHFVFLIP